MTLTNEEIMIIGCMMYYHPSNSYDCMVCEKNHAATPNCAAIVGFINAWANRGGNPPKPTPEQLVDIRTQYQKIWNRWKFGFIDPNQVCISVGPPGGCRCARCLTISASFQGINAEDDD